jgi:hypothetical protein
MPISMANIGWITYIINGSWDLLMLAAVQIWWVETKGKTLEEIDQAIDGRKRGRSSSELENVEVDVKLADDPDM